MRAYTTIYSLGIGVCAHAVHNFFHVSGGGPLPVGFVIVDNRGGGGSSIIVAAVCIVSSKFGLRNLFLVETVCIVHMYFDDASDYHESPRDARASRREHHVIMFCVSFDFIIHVCYNTYIRFVVSVVHAYVFFVDNFRSFLVSSTRVWLIFLTTCTFLPRYS